jgi:hypothetical protein
LGGVSSSYVCGLKFILGQKKKLCLLSPNRPNFFHPNPKTFYWKIYNILKILSFSGTKLITVESVFKTVNKYNKYNKRPMGHIAHLSNLGHTETICISFPSAPFDPRGPMILINLSLFYVRKLSCTIQHFWLHSSLE